MHPHHEDPHFGAKPVDSAREEHTLRVPVYSRDQMGLFFDTLEAWMQLAKYSWKDIFAVMLAGYEAANNAFQHGNRDDPSKIIYLRYLVTPGEVVVEVEGQGPGFDPDQVPDPLAEENRERPSGRGLLLMRSFMTWVRFNREGNRVTLCRKRSHS